MKTTCIFFAKVILAVISGVGVANAGKVTVTSQLLPSGAIIGLNVMAACGPATADAIPGYQFEFWDNQGTISWSPTVNICNTGTTETVATAWYLGPLTGVPGGACPASGCYITTLAFSTDHNVFLTDGTPILSVSPNSPVAWTSPGTTVLTNNLAGENVSAKPTLAFSPGLSLPAYPAEPFRYWQQLGAATPTPIGKVYQATYNLTSWVIAFYGPDPCQYLEEELVSCSYGDGPHGGLNCSPIAKALQACESTNREIPPLAMPATLAPPSK